MKKDTHKKCCVTAGLRGARAQLQADTQKWLVDYQDVWKQGEQQFKRVMDAPSHMHTGLSLHSPPDGRFHHSSRPFCFSFISLSAALYARSYSVMCAREVEEGLLHARSSVQKVNIFRPDAPRWAAFSAI